MLISGAEQIPVKVVGSSVFGRYPKISLEKTYNMFISDDWMVNYPGFQLASDILTTNEKGRGLFHSIRGNFMIAVAGSSVYKIKPGLVPVLVGVMTSSVGEVFIDENLLSQICIVDGINAYIYNYEIETFQAQTLVGFTGNTIRPNYVCYHNTFFLFGSTPGTDLSNKWYAFEYDTGSPGDIIYNSEFALQTKPDFALAVKRLPGRGNNVLVIGSAVCEVWTQVGGTENYRRVQSMNIDQGCISTSTIAASEEFLCFLGQNENNAPVIVVADANGATRISTDGIDYLLQTLVAPQQSTAFFYRLDGHLFYQITFFNPQDNLTLVYDFNTQKFFNIVDDRYRYHPARQIAYFDEQTYFVSLNDASLYAMGTEFISYKYTTDPDDPGETIPRIRICNTLRRPDSARFRVNMFTFWIEQGIDIYYKSRPEDLYCNGLLVTEIEEDFIITESGDDILAEDGFCTTDTGAPRVLLSFSKNGNQSFSNKARRDLNPLGQYRNQIRWWQMGQANEFTIQLEFWGLQRFVVQDGIAEIVKV